MTRFHDSNFDETLLSGYLDGELTQAEEQRVRLRLEDDPEAHRMLAEMQRIREAARATQLAAPDDEDWNEAPRTRGSRWFRRSGWTLILAWAVALTGLVVWRFAAGAQPWWEKALAITVVAGPAFLFLSVLSDRLTVMKHDRYGRVEK